MPLRAPDPRLEPVNASAWAGLAAAELVVLLAAERRAPLRAATGQRRRRVVTNAALAAGAALASFALERSVVVPLARRAVLRRSGLLQRLRLPARVKTALAILALHYSLFAWHVASHRVPALWRFHRVHHADVDMDVTTAARFHLGELALSIPARAALVALLGITPRAFSLWQSLLVTSILFHHANVRLPERVERAASWFVTTPRLHGLHHARDRRARDCNWSSGLALWDRLHGSYRLPREQPRIGVTSVERARRRARAGAPVRDGDARRPRGCRPGVSPKDPPHPRPLPPGVRRSRRGRFLDD